MNSELSTPNPNFLTWEETGDGRKAGELPDESKWTFQLGDHLSGDGQIQLLTNKNAVYDGKGNLVITATRTEGAAGKPAYQSSYLHTDGKFAQQYGNFQARIKMAPGIGLWNAFWMVGVKGSWPQRGEIDISEQIGDLEQKHNLPQSNVSHGSIVCPMLPSGKNHLAINTPYTLPTPGDTFSKDFHTFGIDWRYQTINFFIDGDVYKTLTPASLPAGVIWPFDKQEFFLRLSLAVGGDWEGNPPASTTFPTSMLINWVRVYK